MSRWPRIIVHADMDAFFASIEQLDRPELRGVPILVARDSPRSVVTTASYEARPYGVGSAMPLWRAKQRCPGALVIPPRFDRYREISRRVMDVFSKFTPKVEALSLDEAFLDLTASAHRFGSPKNLGLQIKEAVREATGGLSVSVGISTSKFAAKVASDFRKPDGLTIVPGDRVEAFLARLPLRKLWGVGPKAEKKLAALGLKTIGDVANASPALLRSALGSSAEAFRLRARGVDPRPVAPRSQRKSLSAEQTLDVDVAGESAIRPLVLELSETVSFRLRRAGLLAGGVRVKLKTASFQTRSRQTTLPAPTDERSVIAGAAIDLLSGFDLAEPIRLAGVGAFALGGRGVLRQLELFPKAAQGRLDETIDEVQGRFGRAAILRAGELS